MRLENRISEKAHLLSAAGKLLIKKLYPSTSEEAITF
jgi:hypothetical protein